MVRFLLLDSRQPVEITLDTLLELVDVRANDLELRLASRALTTSATIGPDTG